MKKINKNIDELSIELNALKQENAALKAMYEKNIEEYKQVKMELERSGMKLRTLSDSTGNTITPNDEQNIRQLFDDYLRMYSTRDDQLTTHFSENFSGFTGGGDFLVKDKSEWVAITRQDFAQVKDPLRIELKDLAIQLLSDTIAVTTGFFTIHLPIEDHILSRETARLVLIFRKESTGWKITHSSISIPYYLVRDGEVYPMKELASRNQLLEELIAERTNQLSDANDKLQRTNEELAREISEHKQVEEALQQSNQKWEAIITASPDGVGMISLDGKMQFISDKLAKMFGYSIEEKDEMIGKPALNFIDPSNHKMLIDNIRKLLAGENDQKLTEYLCIKRDNSRFYADVNSTVLFDSKGNPESILYSQREITERKKTELIIQQQNKELQELNATKDKFFSIIAHDLRSPFQGFMGLTEVMAEDITRFSLTELSNLTKGMNSSANNLYKLLLNLLDWAQMQQGVESFNPIEIVLSEIVSQNIDLIIKRGEQKGIDIIIEIPENQTVYADEAMLNSILRNLLSNAVKFTRQSGKIHLLSKETENKMIEFSVTDNGIGMTDDFCKKLFKIEEKVGRKGTDGEKSTGLGLLLCKEFVEKHGGKIWVESRENLGSTFYFTLPSPDKNIS